MRKLLRLSRGGGISRFSFYVLLIVTAFYTTKIVYRYYYENYTYPPEEKRQVPQPYNEYIDESGLYLPYSGYKILQFVELPTPSSLSKLYNYLNEQDELKLYFKLVPSTIYHITLTELKSKTTYKEKHLDLLRDEQSLLDKDLSEITVVGQRLTLIDKHEIRIEIDVKNDEKLKEYQTRWSKNFPHLIGQHYTSLYITIAYQHQDIPDTTILNTLEQILRQWEEFPMEIPLDPIEICFYNTVINPTALVPGVSKR